MVAPASRKESEFGVSRLAPVQWVDRVTGARIERATGIDTDPSYAVRLHGNCLSRDGEWDLEPQPSNRDQEFLEKHRWGDFHEAEQTMRSADYSLFSKA